jgi:nickel transport protein
MMIRNFMLLASGLIGCLFSSAAGHELRYAVEENKAVVITITEEGGKPCAGISYVISPKEGGPAVQSGRTDIRGRVVFVPENSGNWTLSAFTEHGHGTGFSFESGDKGILLSTEKPFFDRYSRLIVGVSLIFGVFGMLNLFRRRKSGVPSPPAGKVKNHIPSPPAGEGKNRITSPPAGEGKGGGM